LRTVHPHWTKPAQSASRGRWTVRQRGSGIVQRLVRRSEDRCRSGCTDLRRSCGSWVGSDADGGDQAATREQGRASHGSRVQTGRCNACKMRRGSCAGCAAHHSQPLEGAMVPVNSLQSDDFAPLRTHGNPSSGGGAFFRRACGRRSRCGCVGRCARRGCVGRPARRHLTADRVCWCRPRGIERDRVLAPGWTPPRSELAGAELCLDGPSFGCRDALLALGGRVLGLPAYVDDG
jgi:hypothetical protein